MINRFWIFRFFFLLFVASLAASMARAQPGADANEEPRKAIFTLSTTDDLDSIRHKISDGQYGIEISHKISLLGNDIVELNVVSKENGQWSQSSVTNGENVLVRRTGNKEPKGCIVRVAEPLSKDPAGDYAEKTRKRLENARGKLTEEAARNEIDRMVNQYGLTDQHVLKLPRSAANRSEPQKTMHRLCLWVSYDNLFKRIELDPRPIATETDAEAIYDQVMDVMHGGELPAETDKRLISDEELERLKDSYSFTFTATFVPALHENLPDENWREASRVGLGNSGIGSVTWRGNVGTGHLSSAWLAFPSSVERDQLKIQSSVRGDKLSWMFVGGDGDWQYLRLINTSRSGPSPFQIQIDGGGKGNVEIVQREPKSLEFPF